MTQSQDWNLESESALSLNLYLLSQSERRGYDTYDSCVVVAHSEETAKLIHPNGGDLKSKDYSWCRDHEVDFIEVKLIGTAAIGYKAGDVVCASFNAG